MRKGSHHLLKDRIYFVILTLLVGITPLVFYSPLKDFLLFFLSPLTFTELLINLMGQTTLASFKVIFSFASYLLSCGGITKQMSYFTRY